MQALDYLNQSHALLSALMDSDSLKHKNSQLLSLSQGSAAQTPGGWLDLPVTTDSVSFDTVFATCEYFTYADDVQMQQSIMERVISQATRRLIVTVRDFKNHHWNQQRPWFGDDFVLLNRTQSVPQDRQCWLHTSYLIQNLDQPQPATQKLGPVTRRAVFFKQLAKFCFDAGCVNFQILDNLLYKPPFAAHTEHVIQVDFPG